MKKTNLIKSISALSLAALPLSSIAFLTSCSTHAPLAYADILTANDIHGAIDQKTDTSAPAISCLLNEYLKAIDEDKKVTDREDSTYMLLNGDIVQGNNMPVFSAPVGAWLWDIIGSLPYQYSSIGNHETDWGLDTMQTSFSQMGHLKWLCCNISMDRNGLEPGINIQR